MRKPSAFFSFIVTALTLMVILPGTLSRAAEPSPPQVIEWKLAMTWSTGDPILGKSVEKTVADVKRMSGGRLLIRIDSANKHKAPLGILDMVKSGQYEMGSSASYYWKGKDINTLFFTSMPFGMIAPEQYAWFYYGGGMELMKKVYDRHKVYAFPGGNTGNQMGGWFRKEIKSVKDLEGLKMRIPGFAGEVIAKLGTVVINIPAGELYTALERGTIDALEWVGPALDMPMGFQKIAPYYYTGWHEPASEIQYLVNQEKFAELPEDLQAILVNAMELAAYDMYAHITHVNAINWEAIQKEHPEVKIRTFPKEIMDRLHQENDGILDTEAAKNPLFKEILDSQRSYQARMREWTRIGDYQYLKDAYKE